MSVLRLLCTWVIFIEGQAKSHENIFRQRKDQEPTLHFPNHFAEMHKNTFITLTRIYTHIQRERDPQHVLIYRRSRLSISNMKLQNKSSWHQTCIFPMSCQKKDFHTLSKFALTASVPSWCSPFNSCQDTQHLGEKLHQICTSVTIKLRNSQKLCI